MGKKAKVGKQRKDKFYHLAKETGYRSRAAFKLIQLNRKFEFLQKSRVLVDLCAAPGGWMQVAVEHMPVSSLVIGVDLFPIKPLAGCISIQEDITTPRCLQLLKKELKTWKVDVVLHDGAPNVGQNWIHDAYQQICLTLSAFKLATNILKPGGYFITKVFRSKDYNALLWIFRQFFKNVFCTKPAASRIESAEIFVACKGYLAPNTIDPKFFDAKYVFEEIDVPEGKKQLQQLLTDMTKKKKPEGYVTGDALIYRPIRASEFIRNSDYIDLLANTSKIILDEDWIAKNEKTTKDIQDYCVDVKVLGKKEIKALISWRKIMRDKLEQFVKLKTDQGDIKKNDADSLVGELSLAENEEEIDLETKIEEAIASVKESEMKEIKKKKKKLLKERKKIHDKTNLKMIIPGDIGPTDTSEDSLFTLKSMKTHADVDNLTEKSHMPAIEEDEVLDTDEELELFEKTRRSKVVQFDKEKQRLDSSGSFYTNKDDEDGNEDSGDDENDPDLDTGLGFDDDLTDDEDLDELDMEEVAPIQNHPLITDLDPSDKNEKRARKAQMWFDKDIFNKMDADSDEDIELSGLAESYVKKGAQVIGYETKNAEDKPKTKKRKAVAEREVTGNPKAPAKKQKQIKLDAEGLAIGTLMIQSRKSKRDLLDDGWNRYAFNDPGLPDWFEADEKKHMRKGVPVPSDLVDDYSKNLQEINARPIKKVVEAKARKKKRAVRKMEKAKKKAESILNQGDLTETERASQLKQLYKKAGATKKKEITYVVAKKFNSGKRARRPAGLKGLYKVVDPRMKKDMKRGGKPQKGKGVTKGKKPSGGKGKGRGR